MNDIVAFLKSVPGFKQIDPADIEAISDQVMLVSFPEGDTILRRGDPGDTMFILRSGRVRIPLRDKDEGEIHSIAYLGPREMIGEMALLTGAPRSADVIAESAVEAVAIQRETLLPLLRAHPQLARLLTEILGTRLETVGGIEQVGKYRLLGKLGQGSTSKVYQGIHPNLNRIVAVKMLSHALVYDTSFKERFLDEARTIAGLSHPNLVEIYDTEAAYMTYFIVMEKISGTDLARILKRRKKLSASATMRILNQLVDVLEYAHGQGIVHRDVKPANCMLDESGVIRLMDFGIAKRIEQTPKKERAKVVEGTPRYLAPEAAVGRTVDGRADIYALGVMAFEMVTGEVPFQSDNIRDLLKLHVREPPPDIEKLVPGLPPGLVEFVNGALVKRPDERLTDWDEIRSLLTVPSSGTAVHITGRAEETETLSIQFPAGRRAAVRLGIQQLITELSVHDDIQISRGQPRPPEDQVLAHSTLRDDEEEL